jgi:hypothetical protein
MPQRGVQHTTMTDQVRVALCQYKKDNPKVTQKELGAWLEKEHNTKVAQSTISGTLKRSTELLHMTDNVNLSQKRQRIVKYPQMEETLAEWFHANQDRVNMSGDLLKESAKKILDRLYPDHAAFAFSNGWLESFKKRHGIRSYRRFGESGSVNIIQNLLNYPDEKVVSSLPDLDDVIQEHLSTDAASATIDEDDSEELPPIPAAEAQRMIQSLETFWMQQSNTKDHFMTTLQRMRDDLRAIRTRQMVQKGIQGYFT